LRPEVVQPAFIDSLERGPYLPIIEQILGSQVRYSLFGMLAGGDGEAYIQGWHRDLAPIEGEGQMPALESSMSRVVQINGPLFFDRYVTIVPGSHLRPTTVEEIAVIRNDPAGEMPGQIEVEMEPGDVMFYQPNLWHRGFNPTGELRWTMHHAFIRADVPVCLHEQGQEAWMQTPGYLESLPPRVRAFMQGYLDARGKGEPLAFPGTN
jgi:ectoine hydroxylase-related dioxygenase (phytanoyl-CoA dioxygenase family)